MRILMAIDSFLPRTGGAEIHVTKLAREFQKRGHEITIVTAAPRFDHRELGFEVFHFPSLRSQNVKALASLPFVAPEVFELVKEAEVIHAHYTAVMGALVGTLGRVARRPVLVTLHGFGTLDSSTRGRALPELWRTLAFRTANWVIATSAEMRAVARRFIADDRIVEIPNGVDCTEFDPARFCPVKVGERANIGIVRRLVPKNGVQFVIEALPYIKAKSERKFQVTVVGDGPMLAYLKRRTIELGVEDLVDFQGGIRNANLPALMHKMDFLVFPSSAESTSIAVLEAFSMGKPVVVSNVGPLPSLVGEEERGLVVRLFSRQTSDYAAPLSLDEERTRCLGDAILRLIGDPALVKRLGSRCRDYVRERYDWRIIGARIFEVYKAAISEQGQNSG